MGNRWSCASPWRTLCKERGKEATATLRRGFEVVKLGSVQELDVGGEVVGLRAGAAIGGFRGLRSIAQTETT